MVVIPTMLTSTQNIEDLVEALEVRFLANRDEHLHFSLLTDFRAASEETLPEDDPLLRLAQKRIQELNEKYRGPTADTFFLFHRPRRWNPRDRFWMGYERKRGKLADLNSLLRGGTTDRFSLIVGDIAVLSNVLSQHLAVTVRSAGRHAAQTVFELSCLPYEAFFSLDAIGRTLGRMWIIHKRLLEWNPSNDADRQSRTDFVASWKTMWFGPVLATATGIYLAVSRPAALGAAVCILGLWFASPAIAWWISRSLSRRRTKLTADQTLFLRKLSRKTWAFFETFVGPEDHWLPPDNYQEHPAAVMAHRTSPTAITR